MLGKLALDGAGKPSRRRKSHDPPPAHPSDVGSFPDRLFLSLAAFDVIATVRGADVTGRSTAGTVSFTLALLAGLSAVATYIFGDIALGVAESGGFQSSIAEIQRDSAESPRRCS